MKAAAVWLVLLLATVLVGCYSSDAEANTPAVITCLGWSGTPHSCSAGSQNAECSTSAAQRNADNPSDLVDAPYAAIPFSESGATKTFSCTGTYHGTPDYAFGGAVFTKSCTTGTLTGATWDTMECGNGCPLVPREVSSGLYDWGTSINANLSTTCAGTCLAIFSGTFPAARSLVGGVYHYYARGAYDSIGEACTSADTPTAGADLPSPTCGAGQTMGTVNGKPLCLATSTGNPVNPNAAPPLVTNKTETTTTDGSGNTVKTGTTTTPGGGTSTSTTTTTPGGNSTTVIEEQEDPAKEFCDDPRNKNEALCSDSAFGGACPAFTCDGDAVACAISMEMHKRNCVLFETVTPLSTLGNSAVAETDSGSTDNPAKVANREVRDVGTFDQSSFITGGSLVDVTYAIGTFAGQSFSVTVPYSNLVGLLTWLGLASVALTLVWAARFTLG